ncbi:ankyrin repeat domain protein [Nitzschia inconspicua]|uniref:Ankyrin repeat domain protein n=1 Tax=Nitzschia inconspicua TaxID=303405 RepID=A0A9K3KYD4_9STRA|nr:ankyrin repeat domain protein [Nitzschia inconspicua]
MDSTTATSSSTTTIPLEQQQQQQMLQQQLQQQYYGYHPIAIAPLATTTTTAPPPTKTTLSGAPIIVSAAAGKPPLISLHTKGKKPRSTSRSTTTGTISRTSPTTNTTTSPSSCTTTTTTPLGVLHAILGKQQQDNNNKNDPSIQSSFSSSSSNSLVVSFQKPNEKDIEAYDIESVKAVRAGDVDRLNELYRSGKSLDACNPFGESLLHMACRRGDLNVVRFLIVHAHVQTDRCDDFGRNIFHDALWTSTPNISVVDFLLDHVDPRLLLAEDVRGNTPFAYARKEHDARWIEFLQRRRTKLQTRCGCYGIILPPQNEEQVEQQHQGETTTKQAPTNTTDNINNITSLVG